MPVATHNGGSFTITTLIDFPSSPLGPVAITRWKTEQSGMVTLEPSAGLTCKYAAEFYCWSCDVGWRYDRDMIPDHPACWNCGEDRVLDLTLATWEQLVVPHQAGLRV